MPGKPRSVELKMRGKPSKTSAVGSDLQHQRGFTLVEGATSRLADFPSILLQPAFDRRRLASVGDNFFKLAHVRAFLRVLRLCGP